RSVCNDRPCAFATAELGREEPGPPPNRVGELGSDGSEDVVQAIARCCGRVDPFGATDSADDCGDCAPDISIAGLSLFKKFLNDFCNGSHEVGTIKMSGEVAQ